MSDDEPRLLTEEERARIHATRARGGRCALCGRELVEGETIWLERLAVRDERGGRATWQVPVGAERIAPETLRDTCRTEPERCLGCGRGVYYLRSDHRRRGASCSRACGRRYRTTRAKRGATP